MAATTRLARVRPLHDYEIEEARRVFADRLNYARVRVHEYAPWPDAIHRFGRRIRRLPPPPANEHNAITLGFGCYFPISLPEAFTSPDDPFGMSWLIHELTHAWQFQHMGWLYLLRALLAQLGPNPYNFGGLDGLRTARDNGATFLSFNPEQQGDITRLYYIRLRKGQDVSVCRPYIADLQRIGSG
ncbi:MAG TPA: hypothetical protein VJG32_06335 [Anaerolineae bacterium]|nr:hypothetical protein [Anaerolineae bacterium]